MIIESSKHVLDCDSHVLVCPINTTGATGRCLALSFSNHFPILFKSYREHCALDLIIPGRIYGYTTEGDRIRPDVPLPDKFVILATTRFNWRYPVTVGWVTSILNNIVTSGNNRAIGSLALPLLGFDNGLSKLPGLRNLHFKILGRAKFDIELCSFVR